MTEILTESFCERCGTRYTFESAKPRTRLKGVKVLSRGLKNFVLSDDTSIDEAMAAARSEADREASSHQLDAFHKTFNFCMSCRQYTCPNCWNEAEARCLSCAPMALPEVSADIHQLHELHEAVLIADADSSNGAPAFESVAEAWPAVAEPEGIAETEPVDAQPEVADDGDLAAEVQAAAEFEDLAISAAGEPAVTADVEVTDDIAAPAAAIAAGADIETGGPADKAAAQTLGLLQRFRPGQSLDAELDAYERERGVAASGEPGPEPETAAPIDDLVALQAERLAAAFGPDESEAVAAAAASDVVEQPTWRITAPDPTAPPPATPGVDQPGAVPLQASSPATGGEPQWPARPEWPSASAAAGLPFLGRPATPQGGIDALWAASNQEIVTAAPAAGKAASGIQPCISCGLSLSATARFCRRCGTLQAR